MCRSVKIYLAECDIEHFLNNYQVPDHFLAELPLFTCHTATFLVQKHTLVGHRRNSDINGKLIAPSFIGRQEIMLRHNTALSLLRTEDDGSDKVLNSTGASALCVCVCVCVIDVSKCTP